MPYNFAIPVPLLALIAALVTYAINAAGAAMIFLSHKLSQKAVVFLNASAAGVMIAASFFSLLLPALDRDPGALPVTLGFLFGGLFLLASDALLGKTRLGREQKRSALFYSAVTLHNIPEGLAIGVAFAAASGQSSLLLSACFFALGIGIQNFPEGVCVAFTLHRDGLSRGKSFFYSQLSGSVEVVAALLGSLLFIGVDALLPVVLSFSAGAMIFVTCSELLPEAFSSHKGVASFGFLAGFALMTFLDLAL